MLSVCIPVYNYDVRALVKTLHQQLSRSGEVFEILLMDDASDPPFQQLHQGLNHLDHCRYIELPHNVGRAAIRNHLQEKARYSYLLFMDCDSGAPEHFIFNYLKVLNEETEVIVGGRQYQAKAPSEPQRYLRWLVGKHRECFPLHQRQAHPYQSFLSCNFLIKKKSCSA